MRKSNWESFLQIFETTTKRNSACLTSLKFIELNICQPYKWWTILKDTTTTSRRPYSNFPPQKKGRKPPKKHMTHEFNQTSVFSSNVTTRPRLASSTTSTIRSSWVTWSILTSGRLGLGLVWGGIACEILGLQIVKKNNQSDGPKKWCHIFFGHHGPYLLMSVPN